MAEEDKENAEPTSEEKEDEKNVSVKGIQKDLYHRILDLARSTGKTVGEITNDAYKGFLITVNSAKEVSKNLVEGAKQSKYQSISNLGQVDITGSELKDFDKQVSFSHIKKLRISDITDSDFTKHIAEIQNVAELTVSKEVKKVSILKKCSFVDKIKQE